MTYTIEALEIRTLLTAGGLDPTFGAGGKVTTDFTAPLAGNVIAMAPLPDGRVVAIGRTSIGDAHPLAMARFLPDGHPDPTFGSGGQVFYGFGQAGDPLDAAALPDGKLVVLSRRGEGDLRLARYTADGALDRSFGQGGFVVMTDPDRGYTPTAHVTAAPDGRLIVTEQENNRVRVRRFTTPGNPDLSFGDAGVVAFDTSGFGGPANVVVRPDGRILIATSDMDPGAADATRLLLKQFTVDGKPDTTFGSEGTVRGNIFVGEDQVDAVALDGLGRILLLNHPDNTDTVPAVARFRADGVFDRSFGARGVRTLDIDARAFAARSDGSVVLAGSLTPDGAAAYERLSPTGAVDASFGKNGVSTLTGKPDFYAPVAVAILADGRIVATGTAPAGLSLVRLKTDGSPDASFGPGGEARADIKGPGTDNPSVIVVQPDGKYVVAGTSSGADGDAAALARYNPNGSLDTTFGVGGRVRNAALAGIRAVALSTGGKLLAITKDGIVRLTAAGAVDPTFGQGGSIAFTGDDSTIVVLPDGKFIAAVGHTQAGTTELRRFHADGSPDRSFAGQGALTLPDLTFRAAANLVVQPDGAVLLAGATPDPDYPPAERPNDWAVYRVTAGGTIDRAFGRNGLARVRVPGGSYFDDPYAMALAPGGRIVLAGHRSLYQGFGSSYAVCRFNADGTLDKAFGNGGFAPDPFGDNGYFYTPELATAVRVQPDGKVLVLGQHQQHDGDVGGEDVPYPVFGPPWNFRVWGVIRYNADGTLDNDFGDGGTLTTDFGWADNPAAAAITADGKLIAAGNAQLSNTGDDFALARYVLDDPHPITGRIENRVLKISGTAAADVIRLRVAGGQLTVRGMSPAFATSAFSRIEILGGAGDDVIDASATGIAVLVDGGAGNDSILGGSAADSLLGGAGDDTLFGGNGRDTLRGGDGNDYLNGGRDADQVFGDGGNDQVFAADAARDTIDGGAGFDRAKGDADDLLTGIDGVLA